MQLTLTADQKLIVQKYGEYFVNTGGNDVGELIERKDVTLFNNAIVALMQTGCWAQLQLLEQLIRQNKLPA